MESRQRLHSWQTLPLITPVGVHYVIPYITPSRSFKTLYELSPHYSSYIILLGFHAWGLKTAIEVPKPSNSKTLSRWAFNVKPRTRTTADLNPKPYLNPTWTPKVCKIMACMAVILGLGLLFHILLGFR